ncbi:MAG TPA: pseudouridine synthase [Candidatus Xenobia bacterium]
MERLQKVLARSGLGSRRTCEGLIEAGRVRVDGGVAHLGQSVDPTTVRIEVDGHPLRPPETSVYIMLHKPRGVLTSVTDPRGRPTVRDLVAQVPERVVPVGRLDFDSEGLLLLTNDGPLVHRLLHPSRHVAKVYRVLVSPYPSPEALQKLRRGVLLDDGMTAPGEVLEQAGWLRMVLHEGRNRQIRRMVSAVGGRVERLVRIEMGPLRLEGLAPGAWRFLSPPELTSLRTVTSRQ